MKQVLQNRRSGEVEVAEVPAPAPQRGRVLVRAAASLISAGTERAAVDQNRKGLLGRAIEQPELVRKAVARARAEGLASAVGAVRSKLEESVALGYSAAGVVERVGEEVGGLAPGDRVACAGLGYASHAEVLSVPRNLCVRVRLARPTLGESVVVIGLGLLGQLAAQLLRANGCRVYGVDPEAGKVELARALGAEGGCAPGEGAAAKIAEWSRGRGADAVVITAATESSDPVVLAGEASRLRGRVVVVGQVGTNVPRDLYFRRELSLTVSMSYGPGRYDPEYEERGRDYPLPYVRWTEGRNLEAFLDLVDAGAVNVERLTTHRFRVEEAARAYDLITAGAAEPHLGVLLEYDAAREPARGVRLAAEGADEHHAGRQTQTGVRVGLVGAGDYATRMLLPHFKAAGAEFRSVATASGVSALNVGKRFGFRACVSGADEVLEDEGANLFVIATRHDTHARLARLGLERGRHVFVEKPLALSEEELEEVLEVAVRAPGRLMVGFNRRFAPLAVRAKEFFADVGAPLSIVYRVNAGRVPRTHWTQDAREGGGRLVGEGCHFVDLCQFFTGAPVTRVYAEAISSTDEQVTDEDNVMLTLRFADGSNAAVAYVAEGDRSLAKERVEIFGGGRSFVLEDFRRAALHRGGREETLKLRAQDKGQAAQARAVCGVVLAGGEAPIPLAQLANTSRATLRLRESLRAGRPLDV